MSGHALNSYGQDLHDPLVDLGRGEYLYSRIADGSEARDGGGRCKERPQKNVVQQLDFFALSAKNTPNARMMMPDGLNI